MAGNKKVDLKVVLLGRAAVGKSCLVDRFLHDRWTSDSTPTVGAAFGARSIPIDNRTSLTLGVWDTAGSERYESMTRHYYKGADGAVICYDLTDSESWEKVKFWVNEIQAVEPDCILTIVGCKLDLITNSSGTANTAANNNSNNSIKRAINRDSIIQYCNSINSIHFECSALTGIGVAQPFTEIARLFNQKPPKELKQLEPVINLSSDNNGNRKKGGCC